MGFEGTLTVTLKKSWHKKLFVVKEPLVFQGTDARVEVPIGFETDLASIPWWARWAIPKAHSNAYAAVVHDFCYDTNFTTRKHADELFFEALSDPVCNTRFITRWVMWAAVRVGGRRGWKRARKNDQHLKLVSLFGKKPDEIKLLEGPKMRDYKIVSSFKKPKRKVKKVFLHCSATDNPKNDNPEFIYKVHVIENGWSDIGYHYYIDKEGTIFECRSLERTPAAQAPFNQDTIAICTGGLDINKFNQKQYDALRWFCRLIDQAYDGEMLFDGHCSVSNKTCPVFDYKRVLRLDKNGRIKDGVPTVKKLEASKSEHMKAAKKQQDNGDVAITVGGGALVTGVVELAKEPDTLTTLKELTSKGLEYKSLFKTASELLSWVATWEGLMMAGGGCLAVWGWRMWKSSKALKEMRLKEEPKIRRLEREALAENS